MSVLEKIYENSPIFFQNIMTTISGYKKKHERYRSEYYKYLKFFKEFDKYSFDEKKKYQELKLIEFINYANNNSNFYKNLYKNIDISKIRKVEDLENLPIVTKEMLRANINEIVTINKKQGIEGHTGGTTGKSLVVLYTKDDNMQRMAMLDCFKEKVGFINLKMKRATFNGKHIVPPSQKKKVFWRYNYSCKQMIYSSFNITEENIPYYIESLNKFKPEAIDGFFTSICDIASYIDRKNIKLNFTPIAIFPTSETVTQAGRELIEKVFKSKIYNQYASSEGAPFITECSEGKLHIQMASGIFENTKQDNNELIVTSFTTHGTPLIRYKIGDSIGKIEECKCNCGTHSFVTSSIEGRTLDFLYTAEGTKINSVNVANLFKNIPNSIIKAQLIQNKIDEIVIKIETDKTTYRKQYDKLLEKEFINKFGKNTKVIIQHVEKIERENSGKYKMIVNNVRR